MADNATYHWFWSEYFWFPAPSEKLGTPQYGWRDMLNKPGTREYYPQVADLHWSIILGIAFVGVRYIIDMFLVVPLATMLGVTSKRRRPVTPNPALEAAYRKHKKIGPKIVQDLSKQTDLPQRQIDVWMRRRLAQDIPSRVRKFEESSWHMMFYGTFFIYGLVVLCDKPWFTETKHCWIGWPKQHITTGVYWYYMLELAFYWSLILTLFTDHKRKDFVEMIIHHFATIVLLYFSWLMNFVRVGTLVLLVHDAADPWLSASKMGVYLKKTAMTDVCFVTFVLVWILSRLITYPFVVLYTTSIESFDHVMEGWYYAYGFFNFFLYVLLALHVLWSYSIYRILYNRLVGRDVEDVRSDESAESGPESEEESRSRDKRTGNGIGDLGCHTSGIVNGTLRS